jgi:hypothetical protein
MRTLSARTMAFDRIPGTGGSGGGGPNKNLYPKPEPQAMLGLNSTVVYGSNVQIAFPTNFQLALGSNLQVCINPNAWQTLYMDGALSMPDDFNKMLGSSMGGNMQLTMGTSANFVIGQVFDINLGPRRITLDVHNKTGIQECCKPLGTIIMAATTVFLIAHAATQDDDWRAGIVIGFQILMEALLMGLMDIQGIYKYVDDIYKFQLDILYSAKPKEATINNNPDKAAFTNRQQFSATSTILGALELTGVVSAIALPIILGIAGESRLHTPDPPEVVVDSSGTQIGTVKA